MQDREALNRLEALMDDMSAAIGLLTVIPAWRHPESGQVSSSAWC